MSQFQGPVHCALSYAKRTCGTDALDPGASGPEVHAKAIQRRGGTRLDLVAIDPGDVELPRRLPHHLIMQVPHDPGQVRHLAHGLKMTLLGAGVHVGHEILTYSA